eukprot:CAMPEP_0119275004 /NCGR_PEP_ID=MMETSP1329-20130426/13095_1 /TAXON_ID=114041 /ORGANISM="Genus nov. species nov., Strain RCC1024" /LENGTH=220 /DNA_ID=CAMNT_0007275363 /DNA_START=156 /DNA_END=818 /DNA_ORIENTATION=-
MAPLARAAALLLLLDVAGCLQLNSRPWTRTVARRAEPAAEPAAASDDDGFEVTMSGLKFRDDVVGDGEAVEAGDVVRVEYTGWLAASGFEFDSSVGRGQPFTFEVGKGKVIPGWDEGVASMRLGGKRTMLIPPRLAYGDNNVGNGLIPPNSELKFECELVEIKKGPLAGVTVGLEDQVKGLTSALGPNPFTFFLVTLILVTVVPYFLPEDNFLVSTGGGK